MYYFILYNMYSKIKIYYFSFTKESICIDNFFTNKCSALRKMYVLLNMFRVEKNLAPQIAISGTMK